MFANTMSSAIDGARTLTRLDHLSRAIWQALAAGAVGDDDAQRLAEHLHARRTILRADIKPVGIQVGRPSIFPPKRLQRTPKRPVAIARRRHLAASGPMPPALACKFTVSELAVLRIVGDETRQNSHCARCVDEIAARAGVCRSMVKNAIRTAARLGLLTVEERRRQGQRNLPNIIRIVSREWLLWLSKGRGVKKIAPTDKRDKSKPSHASEPLLATEGRDVRSVASSRPGKLTGNHPRIVEQSPQNPVPLLKVFQGIRVSG